MKDVLAEGDGRCEEENGPDEHTTDRNTAPPSLFVPVLVGVCRTRHRESAAGLHARMLGRVDAGDRVTRGRPESVEPQVERVPISCCPVAAPRRPHHIAARMSREHRWETLSAV